MPRPRTETPEIEATGDPIAGRLDALDQRIDRLAEIVEQFANIQIPSPEALDALEIRLQAVEERPEPIIFDERRQGEEIKPATKLCPECGAVAPTHFDDCERGLGGDALPKEASKRALMERRERRNA